MCNIPGSPKKIFLTVFKALNLPGADTGGGGDSTIDNSIDIVYLGT